jgi:hypothetical protein
MAVRPAAERQRKRQVRDYGRGYVHGKFGDRQLERQGAAYDTGYADGASDAQRAAATVDPRDARAAEWNAALVSGDEARIEATKDRLLRGIHERQLDDWDVHGRTR